MWQPTALVWVETKIQADPRLHVTIRQTRRGWDMNQGRPPTWSDHWPLSSGLRHESRPTSDLVWPSTALVGVETWIKADLRLGRTVDRSRRGWDINQGRPPTSWVDWPLLSGLFFYIRMVSVLWLKCSIIMPQKCQKKNTIQECRRTSTTPAHKTDSGACSACQKKAQSSTCVQASPV
jgi:hypothetical protein